MYENKRYWGEDLILKKTLESNKTSFGGKTIINLLVTCTIIIRTSTYVKSCNGQTKWVYFLTEYNDLLDSLGCSQCWYKKWFGSEPVYTKKCFKI